MNKSNSSGDSELPQDHICKQEMPECLLFVQEDWQDKMTPKFCMRIKKKKKAYMTKMLNPPPPTNNKIHKF